METIIDCGVRLRTEENFSGLYSWCIEEFDDTGEKLGSDYVPWPWSLPFDVSSLRVTKSLETKGENSSERDDLIYGKLSPNGDDRQDTVAYSFFGTKRTVRDFHVRITKSKNEEYCIVYGIIGYTSEWDFQTVETDDAIQIDIVIPGTKYDELAAFIEGGNIKGHLRLKGVEGFYSPWSPSIRTTGVKILTKDKEQNLKIEEGLQVTPPTVGKVEEFALQFTKADLTAVASNPAHMTFEGEPKGSPILSIPTVNPPIENRVDSIGNRFSVLERRIARLTVPLWIAAAALVIGLFRN